MKAMLYGLCLFSACNVAFADVQIRFEDADGGVNTLLSNGQKVRINSASIPGYLLVDSTTGEYLLVDPARNEIVRISPDEFGSMAEVGGLNVGLKPRGAGGKIAGYSTGRFDLIADGSLCATVYASSELIKQRELKQMFAAMQGMRKLSRSMVAGFGRLLTQCQRASARLAELVDNSGFVLRIIDDQGKRLFEVLSLDTEATVDPGEYEVPGGMTVVDMNEKMKQLGKQGQQMMQQMPAMNEMMQQLQQDDGQMTEEMQQQMQKMMQQLQQMQSQ